ncbi:Protein kinase domain containing protein [Aphelenchoides avenae]|nr:Protein kinase domain containing protein [Aphelenchus avenae]
MTKRKLVVKSASANVLKELEILKELSHPFIVNLWFTFQDEAHVYMISDLYTGGDLRHHLDQLGKFSEPVAKLYICEIAIALQYLHSKRIVHRDVKLENILLDSEGHAHLTDFNLATKLEENQLATAFSGTRPYMAPEIILTALGLYPGYDHRVDWWSLGVCYYEMLRGRRPYDYPAQYSSHQVISLMSSGTIVLPSHWPSDLISFIKSCMSMDPSRRINSLDSFKSHQYMKRINMDHVLARKTVPAFVPRCIRYDDSARDLEEGRGDSSPLPRRRHGMQQSSGAQSSNTKSHETLVMGEAVQAITNAFKPYNRFRCESLDAPLKAQPNGSNCAPHSSEKVTENTAGQNTSISK